MWAFVQLVIANSYIFEMTDVDWHVSIYKNSSGQLCHEKTANVSRFVIEETFSIFGSLAK